MKDRPVVPTDCLFPGCYNPAYEAEISACKKKCFRYNRVSPNARKKLKKLLGKILGKMGEGTYITPPFWCDYGYNIEVGKDFYANHGLVITDGAKVTFGDHVFVAPGCCFTTAEHAIDPVQRRQGLEIAKPIRVGSDVWIGAGSIVLAGAEIGDGSVIGAGSVVKGVIPPGVVAAGVPCRVLRPITEAEKARYPLWQGSAESPKKM